MSGTYNSDISLLNDTFWVDLLSQRDVSSQVPINYVTQPSIALTAACFGDNRYDGDAGSLCLSDLLTVGYRRFVIDVYWSYMNQQWLLCPVSLPSTSTSGVSPYQLGSYTCTGSFNLTTITDVLGDYYPTTSGNMDSTLLYVTFDMHVAADSANPDQPAPALSSADLPPESLMLGAVLDKALGSYIYTPPKLAEERSNLHESWYRDTKSITMVLSDYFTTVTNTNNIQSTPNGWPCQAYLVDKMSKRLLLGRGSIDPQLQGYNTTIDDAYIFSTAVMEDNIPVSITSDGDGLQTGCFYDSRRTDLQTVNNSWALSSIDGNRPNTTYRTSLLLQNYTSCGISPVINQTLGGQTADAAIDPYRNMSVSATWSWAVGEPRNSTSLPGYENIPSDSEILRCAMTIPVDGGHWRAGNCSDEFRAACRVGSNPYSWTLSENKQSYSDSSKSCPSNTSFDVPRTGLENTYLYNALVSALGSESADEPIWINFNSIDVQYCWVLGGANASCNYTSDTDNVGRRTILVPTIAAIVILVITASTIFVKCNSNRRISRRKRVSEGWEYEGVPS